MTPITININLVVLSKASDGICFFVCVIHANSEKLVLELVRDVCHVNWPPIRRLRHVSAPRMPLQHAHL